MSLDVDALTQELSAEQPCGENLEYDPGFIELNTLAEGKPERQMGETVIAAEEPEWKDVRKAALALFERTRDLRVAVQLARAAANLDGVGGLRDGLALVRGLIDRHWETVHPQLDPEDDLDPTLRVNTLEQLNDATAMLRHVRNIPLVRDRLGREYSMRDVLVSRGEIPWREADSAPPSESDIRGAFTDANEEGLREGFAAVDAAAEHAKAIQAAVMERVGAAQSLSLDDLVKAIVEIAKVYAAELARRGDGAAAAADGADAAGSAGTGLAGGSVSSRAEVVATLDRLCDYFSRHEPSSPIPLLLQRAKRLVNQDFMTILRDLAPDGVAQAETIAGNRQETPPAAQQ